MEVLSRALAARVPRLHVRHAVETIDSAMQMVTVRVGEEWRRFHWRRACVSTLPLPVTVRACRGAPEALRHACDNLPRNRVLSAALCVRGPRPANSGHWRYYPDQDLVFTRLVFLHQFDPSCAPENGWPLLAEIPLPAEEPTPDPAALLARVESDVRRVGLLPSGSSIVEARVIANDPAYVVFRASDQGIGAEACAFLRSQGIEPLGRYGRWEYSSMAQVLQDGFRWAAQHGRNPGPPAVGSHASRAED
jgi:protoporphyrinogen oxidase